MAKSITEGARQLKRWMKAGTKRERGQTAIGRTLGVSQPAVRAWLIGENRPEPDLREALETLTGIPRTAWELPEEKEARVARAARVSQARKPARPAKAAATSAKPSPRRRKPPAPAIPPKSPVSKAA